VQIQIELVRYVCVFCYICFCGKIIFSNTFVFFFDFPNFWVVFAQQLACVKQVRMSSLGKQCGRPVSSEISDFTPCEHVQSNTLHIKYAEKTDD